MAIATAYNRLGNVRAAVENKITTVYNLDNEGGIRLHISKTDCDNFYLDMTRDEYIQLVADISRLYGLQYLP